MRIRDVEIRVTDGELEMNVKKVWFYIHRFDAAKTAHVARIILRKYPFIKPTVEGDKCILLCSDMGKDPSSWVIEKLVENKRFLGHFHSESKRYNAERHEYLTEMHHAAVCRFGFFDLYDVPDDLEFANFIVGKLQNTLSGQPAYLAEENASISSGHKLNFSNEIKVERRKMYIYNLVRFHNYSKELATLTIDRKFPEWKDIKIEKKKISPREERKRARDEYKKALELAKKLAFMSAKDRKNHLSQNNNLFEFLLFVKLCKVKGREWILENVGPVPGIVE